MKNTVSLKNIFEKHLWKTSLKNNFEKHLWNPFSHGENFTLCFNCKSLHISWVFSFTVSSNTIFSGDFMVEDNFFIGWIYQSHFQNTNTSICILIVTPKSPILEMPEFKHMCWLWKCPTNFFLFTKTQIRHLNKFCL